MSINPVAGAGAPQHLASVSNAGRQESSETPGAADHDGDADDAARTTTVPSANVTPGHVNVKA